METLVSRGAVLCCVAFIAFSGCKKEEDEDPATTPPPPVEQVQVKVRFAAREGFSTFDFGSSYIADAAGRDAIISRMRILVTDFRLTDGSGNAVRTFPGKVVQWDSNDPNASTTLGIADAGTYSGVALTLGLDDANNALTPADFPGPPLSDATLFVGPGSGYRFYQLEGRIDADNDGIVEAAEPTFAYNCITSAMRRADQLYFSGGLAGNEITVVLGLDVAGLLNGINVMSDLSETGAGALNAQLMSNLQTAVEEP